jgi:YHS domain-containing protein
MLGKMYVSKVLFVCALLLLSGVLASQASAQQKPPLDALEGLDPVMLVQGKEVQGELSITVTRGQFRYFFANTANKTSFEQDPTRYEIQGNGECARMGAPVYGNADLFTVHQGRIYIFGSGECKKRFDAAPGKYLPAKSEANAKAALTPEALKQGQALIEKAVAAVGGAARIDGITSYQEKSTTLQPRRQSEVEIKNNLALLFPDRLRLERVMPDFNDPATIRQMAVVITPKESFTVAPNGVQPLNDVARLDQEREIKRRPLSILRARKSAEFKPVAVGSDKVGETTVEQVAVELDGISYTLGIDPATGRWLSLSYQRRGPDGTFGQFVQEFSDFRTVDGLTLPFKIGASFNGQPWKGQAATIEAITINGKVDPALFEKPQPSKPQQ